MNHVTHNYHKDPQESHVRAPIWWRPASDYVAKNTYIYILSHVTHMNESRHKHESKCRMYEWVMSRIQRSHVKYTNESCHTYEEVIHTCMSESHVWINHVIRINESCHAHEWVMSWIDYVNESCDTYMIESCHTEEWVYVSCHIWMFTKVYVGAMLRVFECIMYTNESCHTWKWVMSNEWSGLQNSQVISRKSTINCRADSREMNCNLHNLMFLVHPTLYDSYTQSPHLFTQTCTTCLINAGFPFILSKPNVDCFPKKSAQLTNLPLKRRLKISLRERRWGRDWAVCFCFIFEWKVRANVRFSIFAF